LLVRLCFSYLNEQEDISHIMLIYARSD